MNTSKKRRRPRPRVLVAAEWFSYQTRVGISNFAREVDWEISSHRPSLDQQLFDWRPDGIISVVDRSPRILEIIRTAGVPVVDLGRLNAGLKLPRVLTDDSGIGAAAARHFLAMGLETFAFCRYGDSWGERERHAGMEAALAAQGRGCVLIEWNACVRDSRKPPRTINEWLIPALRRLPKPAGLLAYNDELADLVLRACEEGGIDVPGELAVMGVDNDPLVCDTARIPLSSVDSNLEQIGHDGAALLYRLMHHAPAPEKPILVAPRGVVARASTDALAIRNPRVFAAVRHIERHFMEPLTADEVARSVGVSRAVLFRAFKEHASFSINELITRFRIDYAKQLLARTDKKAEEVAEICGFSEVASLSRAFKRETGMTLSKFKLSSKSTCTP